MAKNFSGDFDPEGISAGFATEKAMCEAYGVNFNTYRTRKRNGYSLKECLAYEKKRGVHAYYVIDYPTVKCSACGQSITVNDKFIIEGKLSYPKYCIGCVKLIKGEYTKEEYEAKIAAK